MNVYVLEDLIKEDKRKLLIRELQPFLKVRPECPGQQTGNDLQLHPVFSKVAEQFVERIKEVTGLRLKMCRMWGKWSNGQKEHMNWHTHDVLIPYADYTMVYYLQTSIFNSGTLLEKMLLKAPQNSMAFFPADLPHTTPSSWWRGDRYVLAGDLIKY